MEQKANQRLSGWPWFCGDCCRGSAGDVNAGKQQHGTVNEHFPQRFLENHIVIFLALLLVAMVTKTDHRSAFAWSDKSDLSGRNTLNCQFEGAIWLQWLIMSSYFFDFVLKKKDSLSLYISSCFLLPDRQNSDSTTTGNLVLTWLQPRTTARFKKMLTVNNFMEKKKVGTKGGTIRVDGGDGSPT